MRLFKKKKKTLKDHLEAFTHNEEEKILFDLLTSISNIDKSYVDIGASDGVRMSNTAKLALEGWRGTSFEYDFKKVGDFAKNYEGLQNVRICNTKITPKNVLSFLEGFEIPKKFGVLSLDIDSYDYFVLETILSSYRPTILLVEINEKIPPPLAFTVLYEDSWGWDSSHFYGQSIAQLEKLASLHNYVIAHLEYNNLFLIAKEEYEGPTFSASEAYKQGYVNRKDRKEKFPWNSDMEDLLTLSPDEGIKFLQERFKPYSGKYSLKKS